MSRSPSRRFRSTRRLIALALALTLPGCATPTVPKRGSVAMRDMSFPLRDFRLPSGLRVIVEEDHRAPVVAVVSLVGVGSTSDPVGKEGLAHVVEHLAFRGKQGEAPTLWTRLEQSGAGYFNASTSLDYTEYQTLAPRESLGEVLKLEGQRLAAPLAGLTAEAFAVEREVVRSELRQRNETGYVGQMLGWAQAAAFPASHPYARPVIGTHESLSALGLGDAHRFVKSHYRPENVTIVISGDVDLKTVDQVLMASLPGQWVGSGAPVAPPQRLAQVSPEPPLAPAAKQAAVHEAGVVSPELLITWTLPRGFDEASALHDFAVRSLSSNLWGAVAEDGDIGGMSVRLIPGTQASLLLLQVNLNTGEHPERSARVVLDQVYKVWADGGEQSKVHAVEGGFLRTHRSVTMGLARDSEHLLTRAQRRAELTHFAQDARAYGRVQAALARLSGSQMTDFAYKWLPRERARVTVVRPGANGVAALAAAVAQPLPEEVLAPSAAALPAALKVAPAITSLRLDNGLEVLLVVRPGYPLVSVGVDLGGGEVSGARPGIAELAEMSSYPGSVFEGQPGDWGLSFWSSLEEDHLAYRMAGGAGNVGNMLALLGERLPSMRPMNRFMPFYRERILPWRKAVDARPERVAQRQLVGALYGEHAYGRPARAEDTEGVTESELEGWIDRVHQPGNAVVVIAGEFDTQEVTGLVRHYLGSWKGQQGALGVAAVPALSAAPERPRALLTSRGGATQGQLQLACRLPEASPEAAARYDLMAEVLGSRLRRQVREQRGATYGFAASTQLQRGGAAHLLVQGVVDAPQLGTALSSAREALEGYASAGIPAAELERARSRLLAAQSVSLLTSGDWVEELLRVRRLGWDADALARRPALLQAVTAEALQKSFQGCVQHFVIGVIGDPAQSKTALSTAFP